MHVMRDRVASSFFSFSVCVFKFIAVFVDEEVLVLVSVLLPVLRLWLQWGWERLCLCSSRGSKVLRLWSQVVVRREEMVRL
jgi:hypothetical protein